MAGSLGRLRKEIRWSAKKNSALQDYDEYLLNPGEWIFAFIKGIAALMLIAYVFYRSTAAFFILLPAIAVYLLTERRNTVKKRRYEMMLQFREMMNAVIAGLQAGYSIENAFVHAYEDMRLMYGADAMISIELRAIARKLKNNLNIEDALDDLAGRAHVQDITDFAEVFRIAKRSGGDLPGILRNTADLISDRIEVQREIATQISAKKMEQGIMNLVPFGIILYIDATSPGFFDPLYHSPFGAAVMSAMLAVYIAAYLLAGKILDIRY